MTELANDFTITDIPEDSIAIDNSTIKVLVDGTEIAAEGKYELKTANIKASSISVNYKESNDKFVSTVTTDGTGFQVVFADAYVLANGGKSVEVTFDATVTEGADLVGDTATEDNSNDNGATLSYSNNYFTGAGSVTYGEDTGTPVENPDTPKVIPDDAKVFCTIFTADKKNTANEVLPGAVFELYAGRTAAGTPIATLGADKAISKFEFKGLGEGTYTLHEKNAPAGYSKAPDVTFTVTGVKNNPGDYYVDSFTFVNNSDNNSDFNGTVTVFDPPTQTLPGTGGIGTYLFTIGGTAIVLLAGVLFVFYMKKRKSEN